MCTGLLWLACLYCWFFVLTALHTIMGAAAFNSLRMLTWVGRHRAHAPDGGLGASACIGDDASAWEQPPVCSSAEGRCSRRVPD